MKLKNFRFYIYPTRTKARRMQKIKGNGNRRSYETVYGSIIDIYADIYRIISPQRMAILFLLRYREKMSISDIASELDRDYKNIYKDVKMLAEAKFVSLQKEKGRVIVRPNVSSITLKFFFAPDDREPFFQLMNRRRIIFPEVKPWDGKKR